jgi:hypothetical protein
MSVSRTLDDRARISWDRREAQPKGLAGAFEDRDEQRRPAEVR